MTPETMVDEPVFLPRPRHLERHPGAFAIDAGTVLRIGAAAGEATRRAAGGLADALGTLFDLPPALVVGALPADRNAVSLVLLGRDDGAFPPERLGAASSTDLGPEGYVLRVDPDGVVVAAAGEAGLFYGVQTLIQLATTTGRRWPALRIEDRPALPVRGLMLDVSRGKVPTLATLEALARTLAHHKVNQLQLYTEHTFRFPRHPEIGADADGLTGDDVRALDAVCRAHHVELVPNLQSLGHQRALLRLPAYAHLAETPWAWSFATAREESFALLDELYGDLLPAFSSGWLNVDGDEPYDMGLGQSAGLKGELGEGRLYLRHVARLRELAARHGRRIMLWADVVKHHPDLIGELPDDILLLDWWYEARPRHETVDALAAAGRRFYVCPGTSSWWTLFPRLDNAAANIQTFVRDGLAAGAEGMLLTDWGDGGHPQPLSLSWYPYLWGAETAWGGGATDHDAFDAAFDRLFLGGGDGAQTAALRRLGATMQADPDWMRVWNSALALFEDPLTGHLADAAPPGAIEEAAAAADAIFPLLARVRDPIFRVDLGFTASQVRFAADKVRLTGALRAELRRLAAEPPPSDDELATLDALLAALGRQREALPAMAREFERRWLAHARRAEIGINLARYDALLARHDAALAWLGGQRAALAAGSGVDAALGSYDRGGYAPLFEATVDDIADLARIVGRDALPPELREWLASAVPAIEPATPPVAEERAAGTPPSRQSR